MTKKLKPKRKPSKRGPKEERLVITENPANALQKLLKPDVRNLKERFDTAHEKGMKALETGDYGSFGAAVKEEAEIIKELPSPPDVIKPTRKQ